MSKPESYEAALEEALSEGKEQQKIYLRALFDYDPARDSGIDRGLAFHYGDILSVIPSSDPHWWKARKIETESFEEETTSFGLVPRQQMAIDKDDFGYQEVEAKTLPYARPIVILGPLKDRMTNSLLDEFPDKFGTCVPHTTRPRREGEMNGYDYHFVKQSTMDTLYHYGIFIEMGSYNGNAYGTSEGSVREVAQRQGKHCILDVSYAIPRLHAVALYPVVVFIKPEYVDQIIAWDRSIEDDEAEVMFERARATEREFSQYFTAIVQANRRDEIYAQIKQVIERETTDRCWVPKKSSYK